MTPYASLLYFSLTIYAAIPAVLSELIQRLKLSGVIIAVTGLMLFLQFHNPTASFLGAWVPELILVLGFTVSQYLIALMLLAARRYIERRRVFGVALLLALAPLLATRFVPLFMPSQVIGFLGISYLTFRSLDVPIGVHDGLITSLPPMQYLAFLLFFPTLSSGPVDRYRRFAADWLHDRSRAELTCKI